MRRYAELQNKDYCVNIEDVFASLSRRDEQDKKRTLSSFHGCPNALVLDTSDMGPDAVVDAVLADPRMAAVR